MELFVCVTDMQGKGLPLSCLFITTEDTAPLTKQSALIAWMTAVCSLGINPRFMMSDKDQCKINALTQVWLAAKHQLCLWHILRALKRRLSQNKTPGSYNAIEAHHVFPDIDLAFIPLEQMSTEKMVSTRWPTITCSFWLYRVPFHLLPRSCLLESASVSMGSQLSSPWTSNSPWGYPKSPTWLSLQQAIAHGHQQQMEMAVMGTLRSTSWWRVMTTMQAMVKMA